MPHDQLSSLLQRLSRREMLDLNELTDILLELRRLQDCFAGTRIEVAGCLDAAATMTEYVPEMSTEDASEILGMVERLVAMARDGAKTTLRRREIQPAEEARSKTKKRHPGHRIEQAAVIRAGTEDDDEVEDPEDHEALGVISGMLIGEILVDLGYVTPKQVDAALLLQRGQDIRFGEALIELGAATERQVAEALIVQGRLEEEGAKESERPTRDREAGQQQKERGRKRREAKEADAPRPGPIGRLNDMLLGEILVRQGYVDREDVQEAIQLQRKTGMPIGEALVQIGAATPDQVRSGLRLQSLHRSPPRWGWRRSIRL